MTLLKCLCKNVLENVLLLSNKIIWRGGTIVIINTSLPSLAKLPSYKTHLQSLSSSARVFTSSFTVTLSHIVLHRLMQDCPAGLCCPAWFRPCLPPAHLCSHTVLWLSWNSVRLLLSLELCLRCFQTCWPSALPSW